MIKSNLYLISIIILAQAGCSGEVDFKGMKAAKEQTSADVKVEESPIPTPTPELVSNLAPVIKSAPVITANPGDPIGKTVAYDLTKWSQVLLVPTATTSPQYPRWKILPFEAVQEVNSNPCLLLSDIDSLNQKVEGKWTAGASADDDFMGFVFGYQNEKTFYLFDWKKGRQPFDGGVAELGMSVKLVTADSILTGNELWSTVGTTNRVKSLFHNDIKWKNNVTYTFTLKFVPGVISIVIKNGSKLMADIKLTDKTLTYGKFGFYNNSQDNIKYEGFERTTVQGSDYTYQVEAEDANGDKLKYSLATSPSGMTINSDTGLVSWPKDSIANGLHKISIVVSDDKGLSATQNFEINVSI